MREKFFIRAFHNPITAWVVLICGFAVTFFAWRLSSSAISARAQERFAIRVVELEEAIQNRMLSYEQALWGGVALFDSQEEIVSREKFRCYVERVDIEKYWPGIQGFGFSIPVSPAQRDAHVDQIRAEGFPEYDIKPEGNREAYSAIVYLEPFDWRNKRAFGYDMWSNKRRRAAMKRARDTGLASSSGLITLVQETDEDVQAGFLLYLPVYDSSVDSKSVDGRRDSFVGWVYSPFRMNDLMRGILGSVDPTIRFSIYDGKDIRSRDLLYSSESDTSSDIPVDDQFQSTVGVETHGRPWTIKFEATEDFLDSRTKMQPLFVAGVGLAIDLLLFYLISTLIVLERRAGERARTKTEELEAARLTLQQTNAELDQQVTHLSSKNEELEKMGRMMVGREKRMIELKHEINALSVKAGLKPPHDLDFDTKEPKKKE